MTIKKRIWISDRIRQLGKKKKDLSVYIGNENPQVRKNQSYKARKHYLENKQKFPKKRLKTKHTGFYPHFKA